MSYASKTVVAPEKTRGQIEESLRRQGATGFLSGWADGEIFVQFRLHDRKVMFRVPVLPSDHRRFVFSPQGKLYARDRQAKEYDQYIRSRWRALYLVIKAKMESVESKIEEFDDAFLSQIVVGDGQQFGRWIKAQLDAIVKGERQTLALPAAKEP